MDKIYVFKSASIVCFSNNSRTQKMIKMKNLGDIIVFFLSSPGILSKQQQHQQIIFKMTKKQQKFVFAGIFMLHYL